MSQDSGHYIGACLYELRTGLRSTPHYIFVTEYLRTGGQRKTRDTGLNSYTVLFCLKSRAIAYPLTKMWYLSYLGMKQREKTSRLAGDVGVR